MPIPLLISAAPLISPPGHWNSRDLGGSLFLKWRSWRKKDKMVILGLHCLNLFRVPPPDSVLLGME